MYFTDRGIEELEKRRGDEEVTLAWLAERLQEFTDVHPEFETPVERFAIARVEQLYPSPVDDIKAEIAKYPNLKAVRWVQDEPANMGPWPHYALNVWPGIGTDVEQVTREQSSSPSVGTVKRHLAEQKDLLDRAFA